MELNMNKLLVLIMACIVPVTVMAAQDEVDGGFGLKFGEVVDVTKLEKLNNEKSDGLRYAFTPEHPYGPLTQYEVVVIPKSNKVFKIEASEQFGSMGECRRELQRLEKVLSRKYQRTSARMSTRFGDIPKITYGKTSKNIMALCKGVFNNRQLVLTYIDSDLLSEMKMEGSSAKEKNKVQKTAPDTSGL